MTGFREFLFCALASFLLMSAPEAFGQSRATSTTAQIEQLRSEISRLEQRRCDPAISGAVRDELSQLGSIRRDKLSALLNAQIAQLETEPANAGIAATAADEQVIARAVAPLVSELQSLKSSSVCPAPNEKDPGPTPATVTPTAQGSSTPNDPGPVSGETPRKSAVLTAALPAQAAPPPQQPPAAPAPANTPPIPKPQPTPPTKSANADNPCADAQAPSLFGGNPVAGTKVVSGCATKLGDFVRLTVLPKPQANEAPISCTNFYSAGRQNPKPILDLPAIAVDTQQMFSIELRVGAKPRALEVDERVCLQELDQSGKPMATSIGPQQVVLQTYTEADTAWGRVRPYLSAGVVLSQTNGQFSNQDMFLSFDLDKTWFMERRPVNWLLNTYFDAELTSIPAAACQASSTSGTASGTSSCPSSPSGSSGSSPSNLSNFIASRKAAVIQGGIYLPLFPDAWKWSYKGNNNALFIAPIFKGGYQTLTGGAQTVTSPTPGTSTTVATLNSEGLYYFYGGGARLGHFRLSRSWNIAPDLLSRLDILFGKWENFEQCAGGMCMAGSNNFVLPTMIAMEGRLKIPDTFFQIGFDAITPFTRTTGTKGDLRFLFGVQIDPTCLFKAFQGTTTSLTTCAEGMSNTH